MSDKSTLLEETAARATTLEDGFAAIEQELRCVDPIKQRERAVVAPSGSWRIMIVEVSGERLLRCGKWPIDEGIELDVHWTKYGVVHWPTECRPHVVLLWTPDNRSADSLAEGSVAPPEGGTARELRRVLRQLARRLDAAALTIEVSDAPTPLPNAADAADASLASSVSVPDPPKRTLAETAAALVHAVRDATDVVGGSEGVNAQVSLAVNAHRDETEIAHAPVSAVRDAATELVAAACRGAGVAHSADLAELIARLQRADQRAATLTEYTLDADRDLALQLRLAEENGKLAETLARDAKRVASRLQNYKRSHARALERLFKTGEFGEEPGLDAIATSKAAMATVTGPTLPREYLWTRVGFSILGALLVFAFTWRFFNAGSTPLSIMAFVLLTGMLWAWAFSWPESEWTRRRQLPASVAQSKAGTLDGSADAGPIEAAPYWSLGTDWLTAGMTVVVLTAAASIGLLEIARSCKGSIAENPTLSTACAELSGVALGAPVGHLVMALAVVGTVVLVAWAVGHWDIFKQRPKGAPRRVRLEPAWMLAIALAGACAWYFALYLAPTSVVRATSLGTSMLWVALGGSLWCVLTMYWAGLRVHDRWRAVLGTVLVVAAVALCALALLHVAPEEVFKPIPADTAPDKLTELQNALIDFSLGAFGITTLVLGALLVSNCAREREAASLVGVDPFDDGKLLFKEAVQQRFAVVVKAILVSVVDRIHTEVQRLELFGDGRVPKVPLRDDRTRVVARARQHLARPVAADPPLWLWSDPPPSAAALASMPAASDAPGTPDSGRSAMPAAPVIGAAASAPPSAEEAMRSELSALVDVVLEKHMAKMKTVRFRRGEEAGGEFLATLRALPMKVGILLALLAVPLAFIVLGGIGESASKFLGVSNPAIQYGICGKSADMAPIKLPEMLKGTCGDARSKDLKFSGKKAAFISLFPLVLLAALVTLVVSRRAAFDSVREQATRDVEKRLASVISGRAALGKQLGKAYRQDYDLWLKDTFEPFVQRLLAYGQAGLAQTGPQAKATVQEVKLLQKSLAALREKRLKACGGDARAALGALGAAMRGNATSTRPPVASRRPGWWEMMRARWKRGAS